MRDRQQFSPSPSCLHSTLNKDWNSAEKSFNEFLFCKIENKKTERKYCFHQNSLSSLYIFCFDFFFSRLTNLSPLQAVNSFRNLISSFVCNKSDRPINFKLLLNSIKNKFCDYFHREKLCNIFYWNVTWTNFPVLS